MGDLFTPLESFFFGGLLIRRFPTTTVSFFCVKSALVAGPSSTARFPILLSFFFFSP